MSSLGWGWGYLQGRLRGNLYFWGWGESAGSLWSEAVIRNHGSHLPLMALRSRLKGVGSRDPLGYCGNILACWDAGGAGGILGSPWGGEGECWISRKNEDSECRGRSHFIFSCPEETCSHYLQLTEEETKAQRI